MQIRFTVLPLKKQEKQVVMNNQREWVQQFRIQPEIQQYLTEPIKEKRKRKRKCTLFVLIHQNPLSRRLCNH